MLLTRKLMRLVPGHWVVALIASAVTLGLFLRIEPVNTPVGAAEAEKPAGSSPNLQAGEFREGQLAPAEGRAYQLHLEGGQYLRVLVDPVTFNLGLRLIAPDGQLLLELENRERERTPVAAIAVDPGTYRLELHALEKEPLRGRYKLKVTEIRASTKRDAQTIDAERGF